MSEENIERMFCLMDSCNGEIRVMSGRYGGGWIACGCASIEWDFDEQWSDLAGGDLDYFASRDFFNARPDIVLVEHAKTAHDAFSLCVERLASLLEGE